MAAQRIHDASVVRYRGQSYLAVFSGHAAAVGPYDTGTVTLYNEHYQVAGTITAGRPFGPDHVDLHEFRLTPQGNALIGITDPVRRIIGGRPVTVIQYVIQELSLVRDAHGIHTGRVLFQWWSIRHVPVSASYLPRPGFGTPWDYFHGNSIAQDTDGNLIVSARNTWTIYKINVKTGKIMWQVGGKGDHALRVPWCYQHDAVPLGHDEYSVFDDAGTDPDCEPGPGQHSARGVLFRVEASTRRADLRLVRAYTHRPAINPLVAGSVQLLADGDVLIDWGNVPEITEYSPGGHTKMDLSLSRWSYRGLRFAWDGEPLARPAVSAQLTSADTDVWASWNGSTEVAAWQALAGSSPTTLKTVGDPLVKHSFETPISLDGRYRTVEVEALDARGHILSTSRAVETS
jgi:hypothetical protein